MYNYESFRKKNEKSDANKIGIRGLLIFIIFTLLTYYDKILVIALLTLLLIGLFIYNYKEIYVKFSEKYKVGHSYVKRKFRTVGLIIAVFYGFYGIFVVMLFSLLPEVLWIIIVVFIFIITMILTHYLVNKVWYNFDKERYGKIDKENPYQKRYSNEPKIAWKKMQGQKLDRNKEK